MSLVSSLVALADTLTTSFGLKADVTYQAVLNSAGAGKKSYADAVVLKALVNRKPKMVKSASGELTMASAQVTFLTPIVIDLWDKITLPDGLTGPILSTEGFVDGSNGNILTTVYLG
jgi:hypothetical protein